MKKRLLIAFALALMVPWALRAQDCTQTITHSTPYFEGFEDATAITSYSAAGSMPDCWNAYSNGTSTTYVPHVVTGTGSYVYRRTGDKSLVFYGSSTAANGDTKYALVPAMNVPLNQLQLSFWFCSEGSSQGVMTVGYVTGTDTTGFTPIHTIEASSATQHSGNGLQPNNGIEVMLNLSNLPSNATHIVFRWYYHGAYGCCIDDVMLEYIPTCPKVNDLVALPSHNTVSVSWSEAGTAEEWQVRVVDTFGVVIATQTVTDSSAVLSGLAGDMDYTVQVRAICGASDTSVWRGTDIHTLCNPIATLPYSYGFEDATASGAAGQMSSCWLRQVAGSTIAYPYPYSAQKHSGVYALYFYSTTSVKSWAVMPAFAQSVNTLYLSFWAYKTSANYGRLAIGVMTNPYDISTFDTVATMQVSDVSTWEAFDVPFADYEGNGTYIAILAPEGAANYVYVDDVVVYPMPTCIRPQGVEASPVNGTNATIHWSPSPSQPSGYVVRYGTTDFDPATSTDYMEVNVTDTFVVLTGLTPEETYYVKVAASCAAENSFWSSTSFTTRCAAIATLPYSYGFEDATGTTASASYNSCYARHVEGSTTAYPYPSSTYKHSGTKALYMYSSSSVHCWTSLPAFDHSINDLTVSFWAYKTSANYGHVVLGVMTDPDDISTFDTIAVLQVSEASAWEQFEYTLYNYTGSGSYITLLAPMGATNYVYVDDITVSQNPSCMAPTNLAVSSIVGGNVTIEWTPAGTPDGYNVYLSTADTLPTTGVSPEYVSGNQTSFVGLPANTTYYVYVVSLCGDTTSRSYASLTFTTDCDPSALPYVENFDTLGTTTTATEFDCHAHLGGGYNNVTTRNGFNGNALRFYPNSSTLPNIYVLPTFVQDISSLYMSYVTAPEGASSGSFDVGYLTNPTDNTSFVVVNHHDYSDFYSTGAVQPMMFDITFADAPVGSRIAFRHNVNSTNWFWFLDEIQVMEMPSCMRPDSVVVSNVTGTSADLTIHGGTASDFVLYLDEMGTDEHDTIVFYGSSYSFTDLLPGTTYVGRLYGICGTDTTPVAVMVNITTECAVVNLPFAVNAEHFWMGTTSAPELNCWDFKNYGSSTYNWRYSTTAASVHGGTASYYYYGTTTASTAVDDWMILPQMNFTGHESVRMWVKTSSTTTTSTYHGRIALYATVADSAASTDTSNFYRLTIEGDSVVNNRIDFYGNTWQLLDVRLPYDLEGLHRLAFVVNTQSCTFYMDDAEVYTRSLCPSVSDVAISEVDSISAVVSWVDTVGTGSYVVTYWPEGSNVGDTLMVYPSESPYTLTELQPNTTYYVTVQADCGTDLSMANYPVEFRTHCLKVADSQLPYVEDFEIYASGSANPIDPCWNKGTNNTTAYPYPYSTAAVHGSRGLYFYGNSTNSYYSYAAMPAFATPLSDLMVEFDLKRYSSTTSTCHSIMHVGVMSDPTDIATFDTLATFDLTSLPGGSVEREYFSFEGYTGEGVIAFLAPSVEGSSHTNYVYLDSVVVKHLPDCRWPVNLTASNVTANSVDLAWTGSGVNYYVEVSNSPDFATVASSVTVNSTSTTITGLSDYSCYYFRVRTVCDAENSLWSNVASAITLMDCGTGFEQAIDTLTYGTSTSYSYVVNGYSTYLNGTSWHIYSPADLAGLGIVDTVNMIRGLSLETGTTSNSPIPFRIYMGHTALNEWGSATSATSTTGLNDTIPVSDLQLVYDGSMVFAENRWNEIPLTIPFNYYGDSNLVVVFVRDSAISGTTYFKYGTTTSYTTAYKYTSSTSSYSYRSKNQANMVFNVCKGVPSCLRPADVTLTTIEADSIGLSWTGSANSYTVVVSTTPVNPDDVANAYTTTTNSIGIGGLDAATTYYYYIRSNCGADHSLWTRKDSVTTPCAAVALPYVEQFDYYPAGTTAAAGQTINPCWTKGTSSTTDYPYVSTSYSNSANNAFYFYGTSTTYSYAAMPRMSDSIHNLVLTFMALKTSANYGHVQVGVMTDATDIATFTPVATVDVNELYTWEGFEVNFSSYTGSEGFIAFRTPELSAINAFYLDDITVDHVPSCAHPEAVTVSGITSSSAIVRWTDPANVTNHEIEYGERGFALGEGTRLSVAADSVVLAGLATGTRYEVYVRSFCSASDVSPWTLPVRFNTSCGPMQLPIVTGWEGEQTGSSADLPLCWNRFNNASGTTNYYPYVSTSNTHTGNRSLYFYFTTTSTYADDEAFISPEIDTATTPANTIEVGFWAKSTVNGRTLRVGMVSGVNNMSTFTPFATVTLSTEYQFFVVDGSSYTGTGNRVAFRAIKDTTSSYSIYLDDIRIDRISPCPRATDLTASNADATSVDLGWTENGGNTSWVVEYRPVGSSSVQTVSATANPFHLTGLTPGTVYEFRVAPVCADGTTAEYNYEPFLFNTALNPATMPYSYDFEDATEWQNWQTASNNATNWVRGTLATGNSTHAAFLSADGGQSYSWTPNVVTNAALYRDIDFGTDTGSITVDFSAIEGGRTDGNWDGITVLLVDPVTYVVSQSTYLASPWGHISYVYAHGDTVWSRKSVTFHGVSGVRRLAFCHYNNTHTETYIDLPSAIDSVNVTFAPCDGPYNLTVSNIRGDRATLGWTGAAAATYVVYHRVAGAASSTNVYDTVQGTSFVLRGLEGNTSYHWGVLKVCALEGPVVSEWSERGSFTTTICNGALIAAIGSESSTTSANNSPVNNFYKYTLSQTIIDSAEIGSARNITNLAYYYNYSSPTTKKTDVTIWIQPTAKSVFASSADAVAIDSTVAVKVYEGALNCSQGWNYFNLSTPYSYNGQGNLLVIVDDNSNQYDGTSYHFKTAPANGYKTLVYYSDTQNPDATDPTSFTGTKTYLQTRVVMQLIACGACNDPVIDSTQIAETEATVYFSGSDSYEVGIVVGSLWAEPAEPLLVEDSVHTFTGLTAATTYTIGVRASCGSDWVTETFTTDEHPCYTPTALTVSDVTLTSATLGWTPGEAETQWQLHVTGTNYDETFTVTTNPYTVTGLTPAVTYTFTVSAVCSETQTSDPSEAETFTTGSCQPVSGVNVSNVTTNSAQVSWTAVQGVNGYEVEYGASGFNQGAGTTVQASTNNATLTGLTANMAYDVYVRSVCGEGVFSAWSNVTSFTTDEQGEGIDDVNSAAIALYPNPATTTVTISGISGQATVTIVDMNGRVSGEWKVENGELTLDLTGYAQGAYFVRITGEQQNAIRKLIVK